MAIQMRRGMKVNFDPQKMFPGEWAVSIDPETENQIIWMCFRPGVVKRMGTYEDFREQIAEIADEIAEEYRETFNEIKVYMEGLRDETEGYKDTTKTYMDTTEGYKDTSVQKAEEAYQSATNSANSADLSEDYAGKAQSYAKGTGGVVRPNDDSDCAEFYYEQVKRISQGIPGIIPMGTITFAELSLEINEVEKYMFNISDDFVSDERFKNGSGIYYGAGSNVVRTGDGMWDVLAAPSVSGVKGDKETVYRQGFVSLTPEDIGAATIEDLEGINADFVGTKEELEAKIASGEVVDGMTAFVRNVDGGGGTGGGTVGNLTPNRSLVSDTNGNVASSSVTSEELESLSGVESNVQEQINTMGNELQMKINNVLQQLFLKSIYIGQCAWSIPEVLKWGTHSQYLNNGDKDDGSIGKMAVYRPFTNTWEEPRLNYGTTYKGTVGSTQWITGDLELCVPKPKSLSNINYDTMVLDDYDCNFVTFDWFSQWFPVDVRSNVLFYAKNNIFTFMITQKEFYKEGNVIKSPWGKALLEMYKANENDSIKPTPFGNLSNVGGFLVNVGMDINDYWPSLNPTTLDSITSGFETRYYYMYFRSFMIDWSKLFSEQFLADTDNGYVEKAGKMFGVIYGNNFNWNHIPIDNEIKGLGENVES